MLNPKKILLIDDDAEVLSLMKEVLEEEFTIVTATDGQEGVRKFSMQKFDLVISDFHMPKMSGDKLVLNLRELEKNNHLEQTMVLVITGDKDSAAKKLKSMEQIFILEKPFDNKLLLKLALKIISAIDHTRKAKK
jgi:CheY-like chemotaxis protein